MTFDLSAAVLASLSPVLETDPKILTAWADNLGRVADSFASRGCEGLATAKRARSAHLRHLAGVA